MTTHQRTHVLLQRTTSKMRECLDKQRWHTHTHTPTRLVCRSTEEKSKTSDHFLVDRSCSSRAPDFLAAVRCDDLVRIDARRGKGEWNTLACCPSGGRYRKHRKTVSSDFLELLMSTRLIPSINILDRREKSEKGGANLQFHLLTKQLPP